MAIAFRNLLLLGILGLLLFAHHTHAFGAGNIASISAIEGKNWRHGDIEDVLKQVSCIRKHKWNSMMIKRVYFGNWLRDYSQAMDTGALKKAQPETIRVLVWLLSFLGFGYATAEFEVTSERLGVYRPEEHIDNPKDYNDNEDARKFDPRLRGPVRDIELQIDPDTGMKNYIANGRGDWATSAAFVKYSFERSIHHGRLYTAGHGFFKGKDEDLAEACRCLGQGLHTLEDFGAHTNYVELALVELGLRNVFPHVGTNTMINLHGKHVYPLVTGTFGMVDFYHSVLGEATDHFTQSEVNEMDNALGMAETAAQSNSPLSTLAKLLAKVPGTKDLIGEAERLQASSHAQARANAGGGSWGTRGVDDDFSSSRAGPGDWNNNQYQQPSWGAPQGGYQDPNYNQGWNQPPPQQSWQQPQQFDQPGFPGAQHNWNAAPQHLHPQPSAQPQMGGALQPTPSHPQQQPQSSNTHDPSLPANVDPAKLISQIYPILAFRDKVVRTISSIIEKIPGLEALVEKIVETLTVFILSLLAPFVRPVLNAISKSLQSGSEGVINSSGKHQYEVWTNPHCSDPTHSMLSKDHFSNVLNDPAGNVAAEILKFIAPRVLYAWEHPDVPVQQVLADVDVVFHHPAVRNERIEVHRTMFQAVSQWLRNRDGRQVEALLSSQSVRDGKNHKGGVNEHAHVQHNIPNQQQMHAAASGAGAGGFLGMASGMGGNQHGAGGQHGGHGQQHSNNPLNMVSGMLGGGHQQQHGGQHGNQHGGSHSNNPLGMVGDLVGNFTGQGQSHGGHGGQHGQFSQHHGVGGPHGGQHHGGGGGGGNPLGSVLNMAGKLPIPGASNLAKLSHFVPGGSGGGGHGGGHGAFGLGQFANFGGGRRGLDDDGSGTGVSRDVDYGTGIGVSADGADGYNSAAAAQPPRERSPSPGPLPPPMGYEMYSAEGMEYNPDNASGVQGGMYGGQSQSQQGGYGGYGGDQSQPQQGYDAQQGYTGQTGDYYGGGQQQGVYQQQDPYYR